MRQIPAPRTELRELFVRGRGLSRAKNRAGTSRMGIRVHWFALALSFPALHAHAHSAARVARAPLVARTGIARVAVRCAAKGGGTGTGGDEGARAAAGSRGGLRLLEWVPSQQLLVLTAKWVWRTLFRVMLSELAPQSDAGAYMRPTPQAGANAAPDGRCV
ncbi:hypothetical protein T492DRAFT_876941 [Pavlovales sp. CCMP2436]|nr:hypothetical protein T492DRAFT_876941 [Pavlovales sp. CCMP2436]